MAKKTPTAQSPFEPDRGILDTLLDAHAWLRAHRRALAVGGVGLAILAAATLYYVDYRRDLETAAAVELTRISKTVASGNTSLAINDLEQFLAHYGSADAAREAHVMLASALLRINRPQDAIETVSEIARNPGTDPVAARAAALIGAALEIQGDTAGAIRHYLAIAEKLPMDFMRREALAAGARLQASSGDYAAAAATYRRLLEMVPEESVERPLYEMELAEMETRARFEADGA